MSAAMFEERGTTHQVRFTEVEPERWQPNVFDLVPDHPEKRPARDLAWWAERGWRPRIFDESA